MGCREWVVEEEMGEQTGRCVLVICGDWKMIGDVVKVGKELVIMVMVNERSVDMNDGMSWFSVKRRY